MYSHWSASSHSGTPIFRWVHTQIWTSWNAQQRVVVHIKGDVYLNSGSLEAIVRAKGGQRQHWQRGGTVRLCELVIWPSAGWPEYRWAPFDMAMKGVTVEDAAKNEGFNVLQTQQPGTKVTQRDMKKYIKMWGFCFTCFSWNITQF